MGMDVADMTAEQKEVLCQVRESLEDLLFPECDDEYLLRFLIARKFNVEASVQMLKKHLTYWKKNNFSEVLTNFTLDKKSHHFSTAVLGFDKEGSLVRWLKIGQSDLKGLVLSHTVQESTKLAIYYLSTDLKAQRKRRTTHEDGKDGKMSYIIDLNGLPWSCLFMRQLITHFLYLLRAYEANFPEYLKVAYILNAPSFFGLILNFAKNVLPSDIFTKIIIVNSDSQTKVLTDVMDESILPASLGGKLVSPDNDPECPHLFPVPPGTPVPEECYLQSNRIGLHTDPEAKKTVVLNQSTFAVEVEIKDPHSTLLWDFETQINDIGVGLRFKHNDEEEFKVLIPVQRVNSHRFTESGRFECRTPGIYEILFDNTYSWWARKELTYKVKVESDGTTVPLTNSIDKTNES